MRTVFDHLRECAGNGDMPTLDAEDAQRIVETYDELLGRLEYVRAYVEERDDWPGRTDFVQDIDSTIKRATESRPLQIERAACTPQPADQAAAGSLT